MTPSSRFLSPERRCRTAGGSSERDNGELESPAEAVNAVPTAEAALASADTTAAPAVNAVPPPEAAPAGTAAPAAALTAAAPAAAVLAAAATAGRHNLAGHGYRRGGDRCRLCLHIRASHRCRGDGEQESELTASIHQAGFKTVSTRDARGVRRRRSARSWFPSGSSRGGRIRRVPC